MSSLSEYLFTEVKVRSKKCFITSIYRSQNHSIDEFNKFKKGL